VFANPDEQTRVIDSVSFCDISNSGEGENGEECSKKFDSEFD
jgi:hypothetical protein